MVQCITMLAWSVVVHSDCGAYVRVKTHEQSNNNSFIPRLT